MAEGILKKLLTDAGYEEVEVSSAGTGTLNGYPATPNAVEMARRNGVDISDHHSTRITAQLFEDSNLVFALAESHYQRLQDFPGAENKLFMMRAFPDGNHADPDHSVVDPLGGTLEEYQQTFKEIETEIRRALPEIIRRIDHK